MSGAIEVGGFGGPEPKVRSSRARAEAFRVAQDEAERRHRAAARADLAARVVDDPPANALRSGRDLTLVEADACGLVTKQQLRTLSQCHGTPEHEVQRARILEIAQERYLAMLPTWPACAAGPLLAGPRGLLIPVELRDRARAVLVRAQLEATARLRELFRHERRALRALKVNGVRDERSVDDAAALERARLKRLSKAAKRARSAQAMMAGARAQQTADAQEVA